MIVETPPYDLVALFADKDAELLFERIIERGQERGCIRPLRWRSLRDPRRDAAVARDPGRSLQPFLGGRTKLLVVWDHEGSGRERDVPEHVAEMATASLLRRGASASDVLCVALVPELEAVLMPVWDRLGPALVEGRGSKPPSDVEVARRGGLGGIEELAEARLNRPKEVFQALVEVAGLRWSARVFERLGGALSIPGLKGAREVERITVRLQEWFPSR